MEQYVIIREKHLAAYFKLKKTCEFISSLRLGVSIILIIFIFYLFKKHSIILDLLFILTMIFFIVLILIHQKLLRKTQISKTLIDVNNDEILFLKKEGLPFKNGLEYYDPQHPYSFDLDFFIDNGLFQNLNRTATYIGSQKLASLLLTKLSNEKIKLNQDAIKELTSKISWRQDLFALARLSRDSREVYDNLEKWSENSYNKASKYLHIISYVLPGLFILSVILYWILQNITFIYVSCVIFAINSLIFVLLLKRMKQETIEADKVHEIIEKYKLIIEIIEKEEFFSTILQVLKSNLIHKESLASTQINKLSILFHNMDSLQNGLGSFLLNGMILYHIHMFQKLLNWKKDCSSSIMVWLETIGEFETLNSFANFSFNNPEFTFPVFNNDFEITLNELGHPLIEKNKRICNTIQFNTNNFIILTGSNMSGKSTFLKTLGINMVLACIGSPICSSYANIHPLDVVVSMQISDSLIESKSYFLAELKRLKTIMNSLDKKVCFVLLDEILRGTNSDDKRVGTIEVIKKLIIKNAIGAIATHDIDVCKTKDDYPHKLVNKCFEVQIVNKNLLFDYILRDGICKNKSASILMNQMGII